MKNLRYIVLLSLVVLLLASCVGLPPVFPSRTPSGGSAEEPAAAASEPSLAPPTPVEQTAPAASETSVVTATQVLTPTSVIAATGVITTTAPTEAPVTPTAEQVMGANPLVGVVWEWAATLKTKPAVQSVVPDPASYTIIFADDNSLQIKADCNNATGTYNLTNDQLVVKLGDATSAVCAPGSLADSMLASLGKVGSYLIDNGDLILRLSDSGDSLLFRNGGASAEPAPPPATAEAPAAAAPVQTPAAAPAETTANTATAPTLVGPVWQWQSFVEVATGKSTIDVKNPEKYTVTFMNDGTAAMKADCNQAAGTYTVDGAKLTVSIGPITLAACGSDSQTDSFLINLTSAATYAIEDGKLSIDLMADGGRMVFGAAK